MPSAVKTESIEVIIVTGLAGAGKSTALKVLEDAGYFALDNLPSAIIDPLLSLFQGNDEVTKVALVADSRDRGFPNSILQMVETIKGRGLLVKVLFLDATDEILVRRFSETRRPHPLFLEAGSHLSQAIRTERERTRPVKDIAHTILDTSKLNIHQLKAKVREVASIPSDQRLELVIMSFGFKFGIPPEASYLFDVRFLPNPYFVPALQGMTGLDQEIVEWLGKWSRTHLTIEKLLDFLDLVVPANEEEGKSLLNICIGCTGGRHRSVAIAERLAEHFRSGRQGYNITVIHRDIKNQS